MVALLTSAAFSFVMGCIQPVAERRLSSALNKQSVGGLVLYLLTFLLTSGVTLAASYLAASTLAGHSEGGRRLNLAAYAAGLVVMTLAERWRAAA